MSTITFNADTALIELKSPKGILERALASLSQGNIPGAVDQFAERFTFTDHALDLEFTEKSRLTEFLQKSLELFPDTLVEIVSAFESGDRTIAEWKLTATQTVPYGSIHLRSRISLQGASIVQVKDGKITRWSDYYDQNTFRRVGLAAHFTEWIEY
jgi:steroid delta-isomerase-like uncharacterized protein